MSYRGKKPSYQGQRKKAEADIPESNPMIAPTVDVNMVDSTATGTVNSLGFSIPILSSRQADMREGLDNITSRLNRVTLIIYSLLS